MLRPQLAEVLVTRSRARWRVDRQRYRRRLAAALDLLCGVQPHGVVEVDYTELACTYQEREPVREIA
jgi:hypothetical protein